MQNHERSKKTVHFFLNSKGGVGKSFAAIMLAQYYHQDVSGNASQQTSGLAPVDTAKKKPA